MSENIFQRMNLMGAARQPFLFIIDYQASEQSLILTPEESIQRGILFDIRGISNRSGTQTSVIKNNKFERFPDAFSEYEKAFSIVMKHLHYGNSYLVNLTARTRIKTGLSLSDIFHISQAPYRVLYPGHFVCFSPESFVKIIGETISSYPMKGTIDADIPDAANVILNDSKETAEHYTIVDLIRNDLSRVARNVDVQRFRYIETIKTNQKRLLQVSSEIRGTMDRNWHSHLGDIMQTLLPAGSVTGAPKEKTLEIIAESENYQRGFYTGVFGYYDGVSADSGVMIRFIEQQGDELFYKSGGGITVHSNARQEYEEMINKVYVPFT